MIKNSLRVLFSLLLLVCFCLNISAHQRQYLHDGWTFGQARLPHRYTATVPGVVHTDLLANKLIDDPYFGLNERSVQWIDKEDWIYETSFDVDGDILAKDHIEIFFNGLDTYADVYLNEELIINADNMFRRWGKDIKTILKPTDNRLKIYFHSPLKVDMPKWEKTPHRYSASNDQSENGGVFDRKLSVFARKAGYHYGWDWGPRLVTSGIWRDVYLEGWNDMRINDVYIRQINVSSKVAELADIVEIESDKDVKGVKISVIDSVSDIVLCTKHIDLEKGNNNILLDFIIKNPRLWWCNGLGKPELYTIKTVIEKDGIIFTSENKRIGIRKVEVVTDKDSDGNMQFYFVLNGIPVFAKGTNYIPQDNFLPDVTDVRYRTTIEDAVNANMNMIRVWGGGVYEEDIFYNLCDELGLMVWQDFMFACSVYPASGEWIENVRQEAIDNVRRLRNHPSLVLWCGGNECLDAWYNWGWKRSMLKYDPEYAAVIEEELNCQYFETLPQVVAEFAPDTFYWPTSPFTAKGQGSDGINGDRHYWTVWHRKAPIDTYNKDKSHFFSEYGMQSFPEYNSVIKFAPDTTCHSIDSEVMMSHQRGGDHANELIGWYLENEYRKPDNFKDFLYATHVLQGDAMRTAIESHRRNMPYCMGSLMWQHNDCWPVASWSTRDYYGNWKAAHYMAKKAFENQIVSAEITGDTLKVFTVSDNLKNKKGKLEVTLYALEGAKLFNKKLNIDIKANSSNIVWETSVASILSGVEPHDVVINLSISTDDTSHDGNYFLCPQKNVKFLLPYINWDVVDKADGTYDVIVTADKFVRALFLYIDGEELHFDDNYFDLLPGISKTLSVKSILSAEELKRELKMMYLNAFYNM